MKEKSKRQNTKLLGCDTIFKKDYIMLILVRKLIG